LLYKLKIPIVLNIPERDETFYVNVLLTVD
jgi:hypothetical protein